MERGRGRQTKKLTWSLVARKLFLMCRFGCGCERVRSDGRKADAELAKGGCMAKAGIDEQQIEYVGW
jgi:hypothetical protein